MKEGVILLILLLSTMFVQAKLSVSCTQDSDCAFALADDGYRCVQSSCEKDVVEDGHFVVLESKKWDVTWAFVEIEEREEDFCDIKLGCLSFAPEEENSLWYLRFLRFVLYAKEV